MSILIFDLDGTLIDTSKIVIPAFIRALRHFPELTIPSEQLMLKTFGLPDDKIWATLMPNCPAPIRNEALKLSDTYVHEEMLNKNILINGTLHVLDELLKRGHQLTIASNCGLGYLNAVLDSQGLRDYFSRPLCLESVRGQQKADILAEHMRHFDKSVCFMIGDRDTDVEAASVFDIPTIGCSYGFGNELELQGAIRIIANLSELLEIF